MDPSKSLSVSGSISAYPEDVLANILFKWLLMNNSSVPIICMQYIESTILLVYFIGSLVVFTGFEHSF